MVGIRKGKLSFNVIGKIHSLNDLSRNDGPGVNDLRDRLRKRLISSHIPKCLVLIGEGSTNASLNDNLNMHGRHGLRAIDI